METPFGLNSLDGFKSDKKIAKGGMSVIRGLFNGTRLLRFGQKQKNKNPKIFALNFCYLSHDFHSLYINIL